MARRRSTRGANNVAEAQTAPDPTSMRFNGNRDARGCADDDDDDDDDDSSDLGIFNAPPPFAIVHSAAFDPAEQEAAPAVAAGATANEADNNDDGDAMESSGSFAAPAEDGPATHANPFAFPPTVDDGDT